MDKATKQCTD